MVTREGWLRRRSKAGGAAFADAVGRDEILLVLGLVLIAAGLWQVWTPGALLVPGLVMLWLTLPQRSAFFHHRSTSGPSSAPADRRRTWGS